MICGIEETSPLNYPESLLVVIPTTSDYCSFVGPISAEKLLVDKMSEVEYNNLLYQIRKRLDELNVGEQLLFLCRGKVTARNEENNIQTRLLIEELEEKGFLSPDRLVLLKGILKGIKEWALFQQVEKFETKRKEYNDLLERIIRVFEELNDLERLVSICREKLTEEMQGNVHDVRSLFKQLERNDFLGIDYLDCLKEILTKSSKNDLFKEVEEFEQRQSREINFEMRKGSICLNSFFYLHSSCFFIGGYIIVSS